jgi:ferredoxin
VPNVFFGGDAAFGPKNIITAVAHGHEAAVSIDRLLNGEDGHAAPPTHDQSDVAEDGHPRVELRQRCLAGARFKVPWAKAEQALASIRVEVELGFDAATAFKEAARCLNCDVQTVFTKETCIECDACVDICPMDCITFTDNGDEADLRTRLKAPALNLAQDLYVSGALKTGRVMVKDEDVCLHCGLCAERCPTGAWDMQKFLLTTTQAGPPAATRNPAAPPWRPHESDRSRQRFRHQVCQRQWFRVGIGQRAVRQGHPAHGRAGQPAQHLPQQHPGPADLVRGARLRAGLPRAARRHRHDGGDESADLGRRCGRDRARRLPVLRQHTADAGVEVPPDIQVLGMPLTEICNAVYSDPRQRQLFKNIVYVGALVGAAGHRAGGDREAVFRAVQGQGEAAGSNVQALHLGRDFASEHLPGPAGHPGEAADQVGDQIFVDGNSAAALGCVYGGATVAAWYPITPSSSVAEAFQKYCAKFRVDAGRPARTTMPSCRPKTRSPRSAWWWGQAGTARVRSPPRPARACR